MYINTASSSSPFITSPATKDRLQIAGKFDMKIISTQMKEILTSSTVKPAAKTIFGKIEAKSISKQMKNISLSRTGKPVAEGKPTHIFGLHVAGAADKDYG